MASVDPDDPPKNSSLGTWSSNIGGYNGGVLNDIQVGPSRASRFSFLPSGRVLNLISRGKNLINSAFDYSVKRAVTVYGLEISGQVGPVKGSLGASVFEGSVNTSNENIIEAEGKFFNANAGVGFASANLEGGISGPSCSVSISKEGQLKTFGDFSPSITGNATLGQNGFDIYLDNSTRIGVGGKIGPVKADAGVNLSRLAQGSALLLEASLIYLIETAQKTVE
jgi:hypothetical protein